MNTRRMLGLNAVLFCLLANEARTKQGECRALVVKGHMSNS